MELKTACPNCNSEFAVEVSHVADQPSTRARVTPKNIYEYSITSSQIAEYLKKKAESFREDARLIAVPVFFRRESKKDTKGYAYMKVAYNEVASEKKDNDFFATVGNLADMKMSKDPLDRMFNKFMVSKQDCRDLLESYDKYAVAYQFGMSEGDIKTLMSYAVPRRVQTKRGNEAKIIMAIDAFSVIKDMLENPETGKLEGRFNVVNVVQLSADEVEFICTVSPDKFEIDDDPIVRQMLSKK